MVHDSFLENKCFTILVMLVADMISYLSLSTGQILYDGGRTLILSSEYVASISPLEFGLQLLYYYASSEFMIYIRYDMMYF